MKLPSRTLSRAERKLVNSLRTGKVYGSRTCNDDSPMPRIRAQVIRNLLSNVYADLTPDPKGLRLHHVRVEGRIDLDHLEIRIPLELDACELPDGLTAVRGRLSFLRLCNLSIRRHAEDEPVLNFGDLHAEGIDLTGTTLVNEQGTALYADGLIVDSGLVLDRFTAHGEGPKGAVRLIRSTIQGQLSCSEGVHIVNRSGPGLDADRIVVGSSAFLDIGFVAEGAGLDGAVRLINATVHGDLQFAGARLINHSGPALHARGLTVHDDAYLDHGFTAEGDGEYGAVRLFNANIHGQLRLAEAHLVNRTGPSLHAVRITVKQGTYFDFDDQDENSHKAPDSFLQETMQKDAPSATRASVVLTGADLGATLEVSPRTLAAAQSADHWNITGLTYRNLPQKTSDRWLYFLQHGTSEYSPQPYQQFATVTRAHGDERLTRDTLIAQKDDQLNRGGLNRWQIEGLDFLRATIGYGYQSWKALAWLGGLVLVAAVMTYVLGAPDLTALHQPADSQVGDPGGPCRSLDLFILTLATIPLIPVSTDSCVPTDTNLGFAYLTLSLVLKIGAWALVTLLVAGYTNIVRRPST